MKVFFVFFFKKKTLTKKRTEKSKLKKKKERKNISLNVNKKMLIIIRYNKKEYPITVDENEIVMELKTKIDELIDISIDRIELYHNGILLDSYSHSLQSYKIENNSILDVKVLPPQLHTSLLFPSGAIYSICGILLIYFSTKPSKPTTDEPIEMTAFVTNCIMIFYLIVESIFSLIFDYPIKKTVGMTRAIITSMSTVIISAMLCYQVNYNKYETSILSTIFGAMMCLNCLFVLIYHHIKLSKCYNDLGEMVCYPTAGLFKYISSPNNLFEGFFFTFFTLCSNFTSSSIILCIVNWIVMIINSKKQLEYYKKTFKEFKIKYSMIPFLF